jgi:antitoxin (DNA-binding transcriptional repressor) of toxin-antitoxin stability system
MAEKVIEDAFVGRQWDNVLQNIVLNGDRYVVTRRGEPIAVMVPIELFEQQQRDRETTSSRTRKSSNGGSSQKRANLAPDIADRLAEAAAKVVQPVEW